LGIFSSSLRLLLLAFFISFGSQISIVFLIFVAMKKGDESSSSSGLSKGKATTEERGKRASHRTRIVMDLIQKPPGFVIRRRWISI